MKFVIGGTLTILSWDNPVTAFFRKSKKLRHSLGRPSRSDFVHFQFAHLYSAAYDFVKLYAGCIFLCYYIRKNGGIVIDLDGYVKSLEQQGLSPAGIETRKRMLKDAG